jgi:hypothetical protein
MVGTPVRGCVGERQVIYTKHRPTEPVPSFFGWWGNQGGRDGRSGHGSDDVHYIRTRGGTQGQIVCHHREPRIGHCMYVSQHLQVDLA